MIHEREAATKPARGSKPARRPTLTNARLFMAAHGPAEPLWTQIHRPLIAVTDHDMTSGVPRTHYDQPSLPDRVADASVAGRPVVASRSTPGRRHRDLPRSRNGPPPFVMPPVSPARLGARPARLGGHSTPTSLRSDQLATPKAPAEAGSAVVGPDARPVDQQGALAPSHLAGVSTLVSVTNRRKMP